MNNSSQSSDDSVRKVEQQHEEIRQAIAEIHRILPQRDATATQLAERLSRFCTVLEEHFRTEEADGFFDQITDQAPRLSPRADKLCQEHQQMLDHAKALVKQAIDGDGSSTWRTALSESFHGFSKSLMHHESEENDLLHQAYSEDIGSKD